MISRKIYRKTIGKLYKLVLFRLFRSDSTPFIQNGTSPTIVKTTLPGKTSKPGKEGRGKACRQIMASLVANLGTMNTGMAFGFSATALPQLKSAASSIRITESQASWVGKCIFPYRAVLLSSRFLHLFKE